MAFERIFKERFQRMLPVPPPESDFETFKRFLLDNADVEDLEMVRRLRRASDENFARVLAGLGKRPLMIDVGDLTPEAVAATLERWRSALRRHADTRDRQLPRL